jgi:Leucine rich repeat
VKACNDEKVKLIFCTFKACVDVFVYRIFRFVMAVQLLVLITEATTKGIACERVATVVWSLLIGSTKTCFMEETTKISSKDLEISVKRDNLMGTLSFYNNKNVSFLPVNVAESFPNLSFYRADGCDIKEISKSNFQGLNELRFLYLRENKIETILIDVFEGLANLQELFLSKKMFKLSSK